ncbi:MAG: Gfo/Idh/MocA family oxidoreductase [Clostridia bacterium]|nr:Gfo/Idh/MocA family oxidoreductase [Clostridia bacterium]
MFRIGILGSDNSHAQAFAKLCNLPDEEGNYAYDDIRVVAIYGRDDDPKHTEEVAEIGKIELIAKDPKEFLGKVDAVMVVCREGAFHVPEILPFVEAGYPVWIDKPICTTLDDVKKLREACERNNTLITGGSTMKYCKEIVEAATKLSSGEIGATFGGTMQFPGDLSSQYSGLYFYGSHLVEMMLTVFGYNPKSLIASSVKSNRISIIVNYDEFQVTLNYTSHSPASYISVYSEKGGYSTKVDISDIYKRGFSKFREMLVTKEMPLSFDNLVKPIYVLEAILKSLKENREVMIEEIK